jgi:predicted dienelactone hydrolase
VPRLRLLLSTIPVVWLAVVGLAVAGCSTPFGGAVQCNHIRGCPSSPPSGNPEDPGQYVAGYRSFSVNASDDGTVAEKLPVHAWYPVTPESVDAAGIHKATYTGLPGVSYTTLLGFQNATPAVGRYPLVLYSADSAGNGTEISWLAETLASHGFVVIAPDLVGDRLIDHVQNRALPAEARPAARRQQLNAALKGVLAGQGGLASSIDTSRFGIVGTGTGGTDALRAASSATQDSVTTGTDLRIRSVVALGAQTTTMTTDQLTSITTPVLLQTADRDVQYPPDVDLERAFTTVQGRPLVQVIVGRSRHPMFSDICQWPTPASSTSIPQPAPVRKNLLGVDQIQHFTCAYPALLSALAHRVAAHYAVAFLDQQVAGHQPAGQFLAPIPHAQVTVAGPVNAP